MFLQSVLYGKPTGDAIERLLAATQLAQQKGINSEPVFINVYGAGNRFQGMTSASLCSPAGRYDNPIPIRFLDPIDCLKIPTQNSTVDLPRKFRKINLMCISRVWIYNIHGVHTILCRMWHKDGYVCDYKQANIPFMCTKNADTVSTIE